MAPRSGWHRRLGDGLGPIALMAALRETSILFASLLAVVIFKESVAPARWEALAAILAEVILLRLA